MYFTCMNLKRKTCTSKSKFAQYWLDAIKDNLRKWNRPAETYIKIIVNGGSVNGFSHLHVNG